MCLHQSVRHCRHDFRPNEADGSRRIIAPPPLRVKLERVPIDRSGTKPAPIRSKLLLISLDSSSRLGESQGQALGTPLEYQLIRFETRFKHEGGRGWSVAIQRFAAMTDRPGFALPPRRYNGRVQIMFAFERRIVRIPPRWEPNFED